FGERARRAGVRVLGQDTGARAAVAAACFAVAGVRGGARNRSHAWAEAHGSRRDAPVVGLAGSGRRGARAGVQRHRSAAAKTGGGFFERRGGEVTLRKRVSV